MPIIESDKNRKVLDDLCNAAARALGHLEGIARTDVNPKGNKDIRRRLKRSIEKYLTARKIWSVNR